jgi:hypothetical protein
VFPVRGSPVKQIGLFRFKSATGEKNSRDSDVKTADFSRHFRLICRETGVCGGGYGKIPANEGRRKC